MPLFLAVGLAIVVNSGFPVFYFQVRVGKNNSDFKLFKFRTMHANAEKEGLLTVGGRDSRITSVGYYLRKYKVDELPQLFNVLLGSMSLVGPRPEVRKYVDLYTPEQMLVLSVKPGITDLASLKFINENEVLAASADPEKTYVEEIMPEKLSLNKEYISRQGFATDLKIILATLKKIIS
jgi:lipopolysaccharide/colanic/teichoic acid biosynthesis glycosyltransferase